MKKRFFILIFALLSVMAFPIVASAEQISTDEEDIYALVNLSIDMPTGVGGDVKVTLTNITTDKEVTVLLSSKQGNKFSFVTMLGTYTLKSSSVSTIDGYSLGYMVELDDFILDKTNPNGDWSWDIVGKVKADYASDILKIAEPEATEPEPTVSSDSPQGEEDDIFSFTIDSENTYFPNMTIPQIQEWYTKEITSFIENGKTDIELSVYQDDVTMWADWVSRKNDSTLNIKYRVKVEKHEKDGATDIYKVQKKMYDFLRDYYKEHGTTLNFNKWVYDKEVVLIEPTPKPTEIPTPEPTEIVTPELEPTEIVTSELEPIETEKGKENKFLNVLKSAWLTIVIFVLIIICAVIWRIKYKKSDE